MKNLITTSQNHPLHESISAIAKKYLPHAEMLDIISLSGGLFNSSYLLQLSDASKVVLRVAPDQQSLFAYERNLMLAEKAAYDLCQKRHLPVPHVIAIDNSFQLVDRPFMLTSYIDGQSLHKIKLDANKKNACYREAGKVIRSIHSITGKKFGRLARLVENDGFDTWGEAILNEIYEWRIKAEPLGLLPDRYYFAIETVVKEQLNVLDQISVPLLAHGDLWSGNIMADVDGGICRFKAIIDMDHAIFGDPEFDFPADIQINDAFAKGYGCGLSENENAIIRRRIYLLLVSMRQCYVFKHLHDDIEQSYIQQGYIDRILREFISF